LQLLCKNIFLTIDRQDSAEYSGRIRNATAFCV
jgi:hypothetical protein